DETEHRRCVVVAGWSLRAGYERLRRGASPYGGLRKAVVCRGAGAENRAVCGDHVGVGPIGPMEGEREQALGRAASGPEHQVPHRDLTLGVVALEADHVARVVDAEGPREGRVGEQPEASWGLGS